MRRNFVITEWRTSYRYSLVVVVVDTLVVVLVVLSLLLLLLVVVVVVVVDTLVVMVVDTRDHHSDLSTKDLVAPLGQVRPRKGVSGGGC